MNTENVNEKQQLRIEATRVMFATLIKLCHNDDEVIETCVELECLIDETKRFLNDKHFIEENQMIKLQ